RLAACVPGAKEVRTVEDGKRYAAVVGEKVGPFKVQFPLSIEILEVQAPERLRARAGGRDANVDGLVKVDLDVALTAVDAGTELILAMKEGLIHYDYLVNVKTIPGLTGVGIGHDGTLRIGAVTPHRMIEKDATVRERFPVIARMEGDVANVRVREVGTLGGNLCFAEPHADPGTLLQVFDASARIARKDGARTIPLEQFFVGPFETCLEADELLTGVLVPPLPPRSAAAYLKFGFLERPSVGVAVAVTLDDGRVADARIAVGCVGPVPRRMREAEAALRGKPRAETGAAPGTTGGITGTAAGAITDLHG